MDMVAELDDILTYFIDGEKADGDLRDSPDDLEWSWHFPPKINVDRGQDLQDRLDVQAGLMSNEEYHARYGGDGDAYEQTVIAEVKRRKERIQTAGFKDILEFTQVLSMNPQLFQNQQQPQGQNE
jgi:hypothetical protein